MNIFQIVGVVTEVVEKSSPKYDMAIVTFDAMFDAACFGHIAKAILRQDWKDHRVKATIHAVEGEKYTNYNVLHMSEA